MTTNNVVQVEVFVESLGENHIITMTKAELNRAKSDGAFLQSLVDRYLNELAHETEDLPGPSTAVDRSPQQAHDSNNDANIDKENKSLFIWSNACINLLLSLYEEYKESFTSGTTRHKKIWEDIAGQIRMQNPEYTVTGLQCQTKLNGLKKTLKKIKDHNGKSGNDRASWPFFERMNEIFGSTGWAAPVAVASEAGPSEPSPQTLEPAIKKRKTVVYDRYLKDIAEDLQLRRTEREQHKQKDSDRFDKLCELKEKQHKEKMEILQVICQALTNNK